MAGQSGLSLIGSAINLKKNPTLAKRWLGWGTVNQF
jgi:hypothetical protein